MRAATKVATSRRYLRGVGSLLLRSLFALAIKTVLGRRRNPLQDGATTSIIEAESSSVRHATETIQETLPHGDRLEAIRLLAATEKNST